MFGPLVAATLLTPSLSGIPIGEVMSFPDAYYTPPGPQFTSYVRTISQSSTQTNSAVLRFRYTQDGSQLRGSRLSELHLEIHTPSSVIYLDRIPGAPDGPTADVAFESRRFFFDPIDGDGPWTIVAYEDGSTSATRVELSDITLTTDHRPYPVQFDRVPLNQGQIKGEFGPYPYASVAFTVDQSGWYDAEISWVDVDAPAFGRYFGVAYILPGIYTYDGDLSSAIAQSYVTRYDSDVCESLTDRTYLKGGRTYTLFLRSQEGQVSPSGFHADVTITGDGTAWQFPRMAPRPPRRLSR